MKCFRVIFTGNIQYLVIASYLERAATVAREACGNQHGAGAHETIAIEALGATGSDVLIGEKDFTEWQVSKNNVLKGL